MKKLFYLVFAVASVFMVGCVQEEELTGVAKVLEVTSSSSEVQGLIRATIDYSEVVSEDDNDSVKPYVAVSYVNTTGYIQYVDIFDGADMPGELSVKAENLAINPTGSTGTRTLLIPINGSYPEATNGDEEITLSFTIATIDGTQSWDVTVSTGVVDSDYEIPALEFSFTCEASIAFDNYVFPKTGEDEAYVNITYSNGWGREVKFELNCPQEENLTMVDIWGEPVESVILASNNSTKTLTYILYGKYESEESDITLTITATDMNDQDATPLTSSIYKTAIEVQDIEITDFTFDNTIILGADINSISTPMVVKYNNGLAREGMTAKVSFTANGTGITSSVATIPIEKLEVESGEFEISFADIGTATPATTGGTAYIVLSVYYDGETSAIYNAVIPARVLTLNPYYAKISGYMIDGDNPTETYTVTVNYDQASVDSEISLAYITGDGLNITADNIASAVEGSSMVTSHTVTGETGTATFTIDRAYVDAIDYSNLDPTTGYPYATPLNIYLTVDGATASVESEYNVTGMYDDYGHYYETIVLENGQVWLDRNLGATSNVVEKPVFTYSSLDALTYGGSTASAYIINDDYNANWETYGDYFQRGRKKGLPIIKDGNNPYKKSSSLTHSTLGTITYTSLQNADDPYLNPIDAVTEWDLVSADSGMYDYLLCSRTDKWNAGYWTSNDTSTNPNNSSSGTNSIFLSVWTLNSDGGTENPCPVGYRVPSKAEAESMLQTVTGTTGYATANDFAIPSLVEKMKMPFNGRLGGSGTKNSTIYGDGTVGDSTKDDSGTYMLTDPNSYYGIAQAGLLGGIGMLAGGATSSESVTFYYGYGGFTAGNYNYTTPPYQGRICFMLYDYWGNNNYSTSYVEAYASTGIISTTGSGTASHHDEKVAGAVRCILHQDTVDE